MNLRSVPSNRFLIVAGYVLFSISRFIEILPTFFVPLHGNRGAGEVLFKSSWLLLCITPLFAAWCWWWLAPWLSTLVGSYRTRRRVLMGFGIASAIAAFGELFSNVASIDELNRIDFLFAVRIVGTMLVLVGILRLLVLDRRVHSKIIEESAVGRRTNSFARTAQRQFALGFLMSGIGLSWQMFVVLKPWTFYWSTFLSSVGYWYFAKFFLQLWIMWSLVNWIASSPRSEVIQRRIIRGFATIWLLGAVFEAFFISALIVWPDGSPSFENLVQSALIIFGQLLVFTALWRIATRELGFPVTDMEPHHRAELQRN